MNRLLATAPALVLALLIAIAAFVLMRGGERETVSAGAMGRPAPAYALTALSGAGVVRNGDFEGRAYVINVFASWCTPCRAEHPLLMDLKRRGVVIVGVDYKDRPEAGAAFLAALGDPFTAVGRDPEGRFGLDLGIAGVPETFVIGRDGAIRAVHRGPLTAEIVERDIMPALRR